LRQHCGNTGRWTTDDPFLAFRRPGAAAEREEYMDKIDTSTSGYTLISPHQLYERINRELDEPLGLNTIYKLVKEKDFPSVKIGGRFYIIEEKVSGWLEGLAGKRKR